jgi:hypothetical protein
MKRKYLLGFSIIAVLSFIMGSGLLTYKDNFQKAFQSKELSQSTPSLHKGESKGSLTTRSVQNSFKEEPRRPESSPKSSQSSKLKAQAENQGKEEVLKKVINSSEKEAGAEGKVNKKRSNKITSNKNMQVAVSGRIPQILTVTEDGNGDTFLFREALRLLQPGDKLLLKKGNYKFPSSELGVMDLSISGEGEESVLEVSETVNLNKLNLELRDLKIQHFGAGATVVVSKASKLTLDNVILLGNGSDGIKVSGGHVKFNKLNIQNMHYALEIGNPLTFEANEIEVSNSDFGLYLSGEKSIAISALKTSNLISNGVFFNPEATGKLTCKACKLGENPANLMDRLISEAKDPSPP